MNEKERKKKERKGHDCLSRWGRRFITDKRRAEAGTSGRVQSGHDQYEPGHVGRGLGEERVGNQLQQLRGQRYKRDTGNQNVSIPYI